MFKFLLFALITSASFANEKALISCFDIDDLKDVGTQIALIKNKKGEIILKVIETGGGRVKNVFATIVKRKNITEGSLYISTEKPMTKVYFVHDWEEIDTPDNEFSTFFEFVSEEQELHHMGMCKTNTDFPWEVKIPR